MCCGRCTAVSNLQLVAAFRRRQYSASNSSRGILQGGTVVDDRGFRFQQHHSSPESGETATRRRHKIDTVKGR